jgi:hypothetical protein
MENIVLLEADVKRKSYTDWQTGFWKAFLLTLITFGIYGIYVLYKLLERREQHFERMVSFRQHLIAVLEEKAETDGRADEVREGIAELQSMDLEATGRDRYGEKSPVLWLVLGIVTGITNFYVYYFLNDDFRAHEANEQLFLQKASVVMSQLGMSWSPSAIAESIPKRNFALYLILTIVTIGIYGIYWWYTLITDPNRHFDGHISWEQQILSAISAS